MNEIIYLDVLICINLFVNYFLLLATKKILKLQVKTRRLVFGAIFGSLFSLLIFISLGFVELFLIKILLAFSIVFLTFGFIRKQIYLKTVATFFVINFIFAGVMVSLWFLITPISMYYNNGVVYFDISSVTLFISTIISYFIIKIVSFIFERRIENHELCKILIEDDNKSVELTGFYDTGNNLKDSFSGLGVVICEFEKIKSLIPLELHNVFLFSKDIENIRNQRWKRKIRVIPYTVVGASMILVAFKPDNFYLLQNNRRIKKQVLIGVNKQSLSDGEYAAILGKQIF